ncbi:MAG: Tfp pilus assembly protein FimT/FimU [Polyangiales bacterium]
MNRPAASASLEGMTLIELIVVVVILGLAASGLSFSLGAVTKTQLKSAAAKLVSATRFSFNRAIVQGTTVRIAFDIPGNTFTIEEAHDHVALARTDDERRKNTIEKSGTDTVAVDPWVAARNRISEALRPTFGATPFHALAGRDGKAMPRYAKVSLGRRVSFLKLVVPHEPAPLLQGKGSVHFFPTGMTEHAVIQLSDGGDSVYSVEVRPLTGRCQVYAEAFEPKRLEPETSNSKTTEEEL